MLFQTIAIDESLAELIDEARRAAATEPADRASPAESPQPARPARPARRLGPPIDLSGREEWILRAILEKLSRDRRRAGRQMDWPVH